MRWNKNMLRRGVVAAVSLGILLGSFALTDAAISTYQQYRARQIFLEAFLNMKAQLERGSFSIPAVRIRNAFEALEEAGKARQLVGSNDVRG